MTLARRFAQYVHGLAFDRIPGEVIHQAKRRIIDAVACGLAAAREGQPAVARRALRHLGSSGSVTILGTGERTSADLAAFVNGYLIRYLDYNDTYLSREALHPSDNLAGLLAVAEDRGAEGRDLLAALVAAYEIVCRLADASSIRDRGWDHVTYGGIAVAAAAARLLGCGPEQIEQAINIAAATGINLRQTRVGALSMWKGAAYGGAGRNGVFAAYLAREGFTGPAPVFEGLRGFIAQVSGPLEIPAMAGEGRGDMRFKLLDTDIKYWPAEYHSQAAVALALDLRGRGVRADAIERISVRTFKVAVEIIGDEPEKWAPTTRETADHSMPYLVAAALLDGVITERQFTPDRIASADIRSLMARTQVVEQADLTAAYPAGIPTVLEITETGGRVHSARMDFPPGHSRNPLTDEQVSEKFTRLARPVLGSRTAQALKALWKPESFTDIRTIVRLLVRPSATSRTRRTSARKRSRPRTSRRR
ncbi:MAG: MmgE/PrpD family protein [bacterium]